MNDLFLNKIQAPATGIIAQPDKTYKITLSHVQKSPYASSIEAETIAWMDQHKLFTDDEHLRRVKRMEIEKYAGYAHPFGGYEETLAFAKFISLWLLWDDFVIEREDDLEEVVREVRKLFDRSTYVSLDEDNYIGAWKSIVSSCRALGASQDFLSRLGDNMIVWMQTAALERASAFQTMREDFGGYLDRRIITIGMIPTAQLLELSAHVEVPQSDLARRLIMEASKIVAFSNELVSVPKDDDWVNLVHVYQAINQCSLDDAYRTVVIMHDDAVKKFNVLAREATSDIKEWVEFLQYCAEGFSYWQTVCERYCGSCVDCSIIRHD